MSGSIGGNPPLAVVARPTDESRREWLFPAGLLLIGLLFPSSASGSILTSLYVLHEFLLCAMVLWLGATRGAFGPVPQLWNAAFLVAWPVTMTVVSPYPDLAFGAMAFYATMACVLALDLREVRASHSLSVLLAVVTVIVLAVGGLVLLGNDTVQRVLVRHYAGAYPELVPNMLAWRKPVFTFGTHSIAGFFYFLLFYLNFETYRARQQLGFLLLAVLCVAGGLTVTSVTSAVLMGFALVLLVVRGGRHRWRIASGLLAAGGLAVYMLRDQMDELLLVSSLTASFTEQGSGLRGRYREGGTLAANLEIIRQYPLRPLGFTFSQEVYYGDSGPIEYLTRGSVPLLVCVYAGLATFLLRGLRDRGQALLLLGVIVASEVGFTIMSYSRFLYLLPFSVLYLNQLADAEPAQRAAAKASLEGV